jgi:hypothetical protein
MSQYAVIYFPGPELVAAAIGPYRSKDKAESGANFLSSLERNLDLSYGIVPQVIRLDTIEDAIGEINRNGRAS